MNGKRVDDPGIMRADPNLGFVVAVDQAIVNLDLAVKALRTAGLDINPRQDADVRKILTP